MPAKIKNEKTKSSEEQPSSDLLEIYSPLKIGKILPTSNKKKENVFQNFQPKTGECLDYNISETFVKWNVGDTKINVKEVKATYVPLPPDSVKIGKKKKVKYSHGAPPQWEFVDEIWRNKQDELQLQNKKNFKQFLIRRNQRCMQQAAILHNLITSMVGPAWFQELSPKQLRTVERLSLSMLRDFRDGTIVHTNETIADLGLVLRPNSKHVGLALKLCCGCPVEFLLILYQLINPKRKSYSINDRLLLSAVVHLTMTETLRELHIRIPSPPKRKKTKPKVPKRVEKKDYKSPYLVPYTFKAERQKCSGIYENKHIQYPESPYFSYLDSLHWEIKNCENILDSELPDMEDAGERELLEDMQNAQKFYNTICKNVGTIKLLRPTIKKTCQDFQIYSNRSKREKDKLVLPPLAELEDTSEKCTCLEPIKDSDDDDCCEHDFFEACECEDSCCCKEKSKLFMSSLCQRCIAQRQHKNARNIVTGVTITKDQNVIPIIGGTFIEKTCECLTEYKLTLKGVAARNRIKCQKAVFVIGGVVHTKIGPVYLISTALVKNHRVVEKEEPTCSMRNSKCICEKPAEDETEAKKGIHRSDDNLIGITKKKAVTREKRDCECRKELDRFLEHKCTCEECQTEASKQTTYILQGIKTIQEKPVNIIAGVQDQKCDCLHKYLDTIKKVDEYRDRAMARYELKQQITKYVVTGVTNTPEGPVYSIGGVRSPVQCVCAEVARRRKEEEEHSKRMARMPNTGRIKYEISGVRHGSQENTFIISKALPVEPCSCEKLFEQYENAHRSCLDYFDEYLAQIAAELGENDGEESEAIEEAPVASVENPAALPSVDVSAPFQPSLMPEKLNSTKLESVGSSCYGVSSSSSSQPNADVKKSCDNELEEVSECCQTNSDPSIAPLDSSPLAPIKSAGNKSEVELKRFVVLDKIPSDFRKQMAILKKVLSRMAVDGFPLAKLPDCHKLPHFKLWMQLRCGKFWKQKDRSYYENFSKFGSKHTQVCYHEVPIPKLNLSYEDAAKFSWFDAKFCRELIRQKNEIYHRAVKQQRINGAREHFPLTFSYEFPCPTFRDCYFAYFPSKEEDIFVGGS
ncbi:unnamed protein product [Phaedon cochleariae]|uniref:Uncharacterized protein n=1 Tax=Phaedon cochleariae TaxID=80249 RepID=A0A9P0DIW5_PHACE|nr:unnamed protein product [Phaedon cochleariae]